MALPRLIWSFLLFAVLAAFLVLATHASDPVKRVLVVVVPNAEITTAPKEVELVPAIEPSIRFSSRLPQPAPSGHVTPPKATMTRGDLAKIVRSLDYSRFSAVDYGSAFGR